MGSESPSGDGAARDSAGAVRPSEDELFESLYAELRRVAAGQLARESGPQTLNPTALVHEAFVRFRINPVACVNDHRHFVRLVSRVMRQLLIDRARRRQSAKRGRDPLVVTLSEDAVADSARSVCADEIVEIDRALERLAARDSAMAALVELRFFGGFSNAQIAEVLEISPRSVSRLWQAARAWMNSRIDGER